jgi:hypothetical protein
MPPYPPSFAAAWEAFRDGETVDEAEANRGLMRGLLAVIEVAPMSKVLMPDSI